MLRKVIGRIKVSLKNLPRWKPGPPIGRETEPDIEEEEVMLTGPMLKETIQKLKTTIKGRAQTSRWMRQEANKLSGEDKHNKHLNMRDYGKYTRHYLLAYGLLRGKNYREIERFAREEPSTHLIRCYLEDAAGDAFWTKEEIDNWLCQDPVVEEMAA